MEKSQNYHIKMPQAGYYTLEEIAAKEGRLLADVVREALEEYTQRKGYRVSFAVQRGGRRRDPVERKGQHANRDALQRWTNEGGQESGSK